MARRNEPEKVIVYTVEAGHGYTGVNVRETPNENSLVLYVAPNGSMIKPNNRKSTPVGWTAVQGGGYIKNDYLK